MLNTLILYALLLVAGYCERPCTFVMAQQQQPQSVQVFYQEVSWSPDGKRLSFSALKNKNWDIYVMSADGSGVTNLTSGTETDLYGSWSPDGKRMVFSSKRGGTKSDIYMMNADGTNTVRLTTDSGNNVTPSWSPDGKRIAFVSDRDGVLRIYTMKPDGSNQTRITSESVKHYNPVWSPDGKRILFYTDKGDRKDQIYVVNADGSEPKLLTGGAGHNFFPSWSPDGKSIIFTSTRDAAEGGNGEAGIYTMKVNGTELKKLAIPQRAFFARFSPDGKRIAFIAGGYPESVIYLVNPDGSGLVKLTQ